MTFDPAFLKKIEEALLKEKEKVEHELSEFTVSDSSGRQEIVFPEYGEQSAENAAEVASFDSDSSLKNVLNATLRDINSSLKRIKDGTYGICKYCGQEISRERLAIRPTSSSCVECKKKFTNE
ncbi:MAG TPA: TraR/DksA C4-type zinc finger protein [Patescibacteria group bacterium]|nr:TraR/DksA C4-type zinc finger protein [Patescibacteria group bacterium]